MNQRGGRIAIAGLLLSLLLAGCRSVPSFDGEGGIEMTGTRLAIDDARARHVLQNYLALAHARPALRGSARVLLEGPDFKLNRPQRILVERPARVRFEVIGLFDQLAALLATNGSRFDFYDVSTGRISRGRVTPTLLWDLAKIDLDVDEFVGLLLAAPVPTPGIARSSVWLEPDGGIVLVFAWPKREPSANCRILPDRALLEADCFVPAGSPVEGGEMFLFDVDGRLAELRSLDQDGSLRFRATFDDYQPLAVSVGDVEFPNRITIRSPGAASLASFEWTRVMLTDTLSDRFFTIPDRGAANRDG